jgi:hypothetical protein
METLTNTACVQVAAGISPWKSASWRARHE